MITYCNHVGSVYPESASPIMCADGFLTSPKLRLLKSGLGLSSLLEYLEAEQPELYNLNISAKLSLGARAVLATCLVAVWLTFETHHPHVPRVAKGDLTKIRREVLPRFKKPEVCFCCYPQGAFMKFMAKSVNGLRDSLRVTAEEATTIAIAITIAIEALDLASTKEHDKPGTRPKRKFKGPSV